MNNIFRNTTSFKKKTKITNTTINNTMNACINATYKSNSNQIKTCKSTNVITHNNT